MPHARHWCKWWHLSRHRCFTLSGGESERCLGSLPWPCPVPCRNWCENGGDSLEPSLMSSVGVLLPREGKMLDLSTAAGSGGAGLRAAPPGGPSRRARRAQGEQEAGAGRGLGSPSPCCPLCPPSPTIRGLASHLVSDPGRLGNAPARVAPQRHLLGSEGAYSLWCTPRGATALGRRSCGLREVTCLSCSSRYPVGLTVPEYLGSLHHPRTAPHPAVQVILPTAMGSMAQPVWLWKWRLGAVTSPPALLHGLQVGSPEQGSW